MRDQDRVEYRMDLDAALKALDEGGIPARLSWRRVEANAAAQPVCAAGLFRQAAEGDSAVHPEDDALGFLRNLLDDSETAQALERIQIGTCAGSVRRPCSMACAA